LEIPSALVDKLRSAQRVVVLTGAGVSAESGVPTFRQAQTGLWARYDPQSLATAAAFTANPGLVWEWYAWRRSLVAQAAPNPGHYALAELEQRIPEFSLITQNVDGLHQRAGSHKIIELHGNIQRTKCFDEHTVIETWQEHIDVPPRCPHCGGMLRPDVVWFGESLPPEALEAAWEAVEHCELFFTIGTSGVVEPAASLPNLALQAGAVVVEINPQPTPQTRLASYILRGPSGVLLPELIARIWPNFP
jgi:NAD-dependent deacetylase